MNDVNRQAGRPGLRRDGSQVILASRPQDDLRLTVAQPGAKVSGPDPGQRGGNRSVRRLRGYLAATHAEVGADNQRQLGLHD